MGQEDGFGTQPGVLWVEPGTPSHSAGRGTGWPHPLLVPAAPEGWASLPVKAQLHVTRTTLVWLPPAPHTQLGCLCP